MSDKRSYTLSVRLEPRVEQELAAYCEAHHLTRSEAAKRALTGLLRASRRTPSAWRLGQRFRASDRRTGDVARHTKRLLRERFR